MSTTETRRRTSCRPPIRRSAVTRRSRPHRSSSAFTLRGCSSARPDVLRSSRRASAYHRVMRWAILTFVAGCGGSSATPDGTTGGDGPGGDGGVGPLAMLPDTTNGIHLFADQFDPGYSDAVVRFAATHYAGTQKMLKDANARFVAVNPNWFLLHYRLGSSSGPVQYIHDNM